MLETADQNTEQAELSELENKKTDVLEQLLKPEIHEALTALIDQLPKLVEMTALLTKTYEFTQKVATDRVLIQDTVGAIMEVMMPLGEKAKHFASIAIEANDRAEKEDKTIGLFGMLRLLKDPELQKILRFGQAYLEILGERKK
ncbi:DUF1641 domain-containing protein [Paenibacillus prosopidis]|uniref:Uncharacterized protein YjgD (DUF1641 family) n=1 Tax=Paenibacillus prosopidis TaxID=630520 RepID=A0A368W2Z8_9BACL|nr:DUF1641 domain-containing protein [Paenibacillus prosopidis]RCW46395.1 uncharacterized protein YjgD (DUF1641 family) [Paenibacillus prosopidis]